VYFNALGDITRSLFNVVFRGKVSWQGKVTTHTNFSIICIKNAIHKKKRNLEGDHPLTSFVLIKLHYSEDPADRTSICIPDDDIPLAQSG
jgi:hypothetical protein